MNGGAQPNVWQLHEEETACHFYGFWSEYGHGLFEKKNVMEMRRNSERREFLISSGNNHANLLIFNDSKAFAIWKTFNKIFEFVFELSEDRKVSVRFVNCLINQRHKRC